VLSNASGARTSQWGTLHVVAAPVITKNPVSTKTLHRGSTFSFSSAATGDPAPAPTWQISQDGGATWQVLETGRPNVSFTLPSSPLSGPVRRALTGSAALSAAAPQDLVRVIYQNAYGTATSSTAAINFADTFPDVSPGASVSPSPAAVGDPATATVTVGDYSGVTATSVKAVAKFSASLGLGTFTQISGPKATCKVTSVTGGKAATCTWATLPGHSKATFHASLRPKQGTKTGTIAIGTTLKQVNGALGTTTLTVPITRPWADVQLTGTAPKSEKLGAAFSDMVTVRDAGPATATKGKVVITLPAAVKLVKATGPGAACTTRKATVTCTITKLTAGHTVKLTLNLKGAKKGASTLVAQVSAATPDYLPANNSLSLSTLIS
jgi:hypothetical protein